MKALKWILVVVLFGGIIVGIYFFTNQNKKDTDLSTTGYEPDQKLILEVEGRTWTFEQSKQTQIIASLDGGNDLVTFVGGTFPLTKIVEKRSQKDKSTKFDASEREVNKVLINKLIDKHGEFVKQASQRFSIPELFIYIVMAVENTEGKTTYVSPGGYVGLMQIDTSSAADTLTTQKRRRLLKVSDLQFFQKKFGSSVFASGNQVTNSALKDVEANINAGALHLSEMIVDNKFDLVKDMHKIFFSYNRGKNRLDNDKTKSLGIDEMIKHYLGTSHNVGAEYIIRALGPHGAADILVNELGITA